MGVEGYGVLGRSREETGWVWGGREIQRGDSGCGEVGRSREETVGVGSEKGSDLYSFQSSAM